MESRDSETIVYRGYMISWRSDTENTSYIDNATRLPLLLCRGTPNTMKTVHATLSYMFDCSFLPLKTSSEDLAWLLPIILSSGEVKEKINRSKGPTEATLEFTLPNVPASSNISIKFLISNLIQLWKRYFFFKISQSSILYDVNIDILV